MIELSKTNKRIAREIIEKGLQKEFESGLQEAEKIILDKNIKGQSPQETYHELLKNVIDFNKHIARRYDNMKGSNYVLIIACQLLDGYITDEEIQPLADEVKQCILQYVGLRQK